MKLLLDTDTCIDLLRGNETAVRHARKHSPSDLAVAAITRYELLYGVERCPANWKKREGAKVHLLLDQVKILSFTGETAAIAASVRAFLEQNGYPVGPMDLLIAATALEKRMPVITRNLREFQRVPDLQCESWGE